MSSTVASSILIFFERRSTVEIVNVIAYMIIIVVGAIGNIWVAWKVGVVLAFSKNRGAVTHGILVCILIICVSDLVVLSALSLLVDNKLNGEWRFGDILCKLFYAVEVLNKFVIPICLVQISRISYNSVNISGRRAVSGVWLLRLSNAIAIVTIGLLLAYVLVFSGVFEIYMNSDRSPKICVFSPPKVHDLIFNGTAFLVGYVLTSVAYVYFYASVPLLLKRRISMHGPNSFQRLNDANIDKIKYTVTSFVLVYLICWTPYWVLFWFLSVSRGPLPNWVIMTSMSLHTLPYLSCTAYPIILTMLNKGIKSEHASILLLQKKKLSTIRSGAMQALTAHVGMLHMWMRESESGNGRKTTRSSNAAAVAV